ncbi:MAG: GntR family transcriptional regulator [Dethiobacteria bacterium]
MHCYITLIQLLGVEGLRFFINSRSAVPIYHQLVEQIKNAVASGMLAPGQQLPSVRELAGELAINPNTVIRAYSILESEGIIYRRQGSGTFVAKNSVPSGDYSRLEEKIQDLLVEAYHLKVGEEELRKLFEGALNKWKKSEVE